MDRVAAQDGMNVVIVVEPGSVAHELQRLKFAAAAIHRWHCPSIRLIMMIQFRLPPALRYLAFGERELRKLQAVHLRSDD
jgi:hypothetical protein